MFISPVSLENKTYIFFGFYLFFYSFFPCLYFAKRIIFFKNSIKQRNKEIFFFVVLLKSCLRNSQLQKISVVVPVYNKKDLIIISFFISLYFINTLFLDNQSNSMINCTNLNYDVSSRYFISTYQSADIYYIKNISTFFSFKVHA